ncbi:unnamed protein product [Ectocarpus sp. CCAP 1310/34]|nr:unnamed protein product [Ectocarpus sp. CCAP 1310/34]
MLRPTLALRGLPPLRESRVHRAHDPDGLSPIQRRCCLQQELRLLVLGWEGTNEVGENEGVVQH